MEFTQVAVATDGAFRKQADTFPGPQQAVDGAQALLALAGGYGYHAKGLEKGLQVPQVIDALEHDEADGPGAGNLHQGPVYPGNMIAQQQGRAGLRDVVKADDLHPVAAFQYPGRENANQRMRQLAYGVTGADDRNRGEYIEQAHAADPDQ